MDNDRGRRISTGGTSREYNVAVCRKTSNQKKNLRTGDLEEKGSSLGPEASSVLRRSLHEGPFTQVKKYGGRRGR